MILMSTIDETRQAVQNARQNGLRVGLVPTMGYLHAGHRSLIEQARRENDRVIVSIFVNPTQFGPNEDFASYPRNLTNDLTLCQAAGADWVFAPAAAEIYPQPNHIKFDVAGLGDYLCGSRRPGHFGGVCLIVSKLFNICQPDRAYFGDKDAQQLAIIRVMTTDLNFPIEIIGCPIVREPDGLAMSSRNAYLDPAQRQAAQVVPRVLDRARGALATGERDVALIIRQMQAEVDQEPLASADYLSIVDSLTLQPVDKINGNILVAVAVRIGTTRLIDNLTFAIEKEGTNSCS